MKKILTAIIIAFAAAFMAPKASAQFYVGGGLSGGFTGNVTEIGFVPEFGYHINNNLSAGLIVGYTYRKNRNYDYSVHRFLVDPYLRASYAVAGKVIVMADAFFQYNRLSYRESGTTMGYNVYKTGIRPGLAIPIGGKMYLTARVGYLGYMDGEGSDNDGKFTYHCSANDIYVGFVMHL